MNPSAIIQALENALQVATGVPGIVGAILVAVVGLAIAALLIANYFYARGQREAAAYQAQLQAQQTQAANLAQMQKDAAQAMIDNMDAVYQQDYDYFVQMLSATPPNTEAVYAKLALQFQAQLADFIYDPTIPATQKAAQIIILMKQAAGTSS